MGISNRFADISVPNQPGRICRLRVNECANPKKYNVDCSANSGFYDFYIIISGIRFMKKYSTN